MGAGAFRQGHALKRAIHQLPAVSLAETLALGAGIVDLWYFFPEAMHGKSPFAGHTAIMASDERKRHESFRFERDRNLFLATRMLVRIVLSRYADVTPADWRFAVGEHGKPYISSPIVKPQIHFNLTNTSGLVACAVSLAHERVGVDAEWIDGQANLVELADLYFSSSEARAIRALPAIEQPRQFFAYWTLKESFLKACG